MSNDLVRGLEKVRWLVGKHWFTAHEAIQKSFRGTGLVGTATDLILWELDREATLLLAIDRAIQKAKEESDD